MKGYCGAQERTGVVIVTRGDFDSSVEQILTIHCQRVGGVGSWSHHLKYSYLPSVIALCGHVRSMFVTQGKHRLTVMLTVE